MKCIIGRKLGMSTVYRENPSEKTVKAIVVTVLDCTPNVVGLVRTDERDGYRAVQLRLQSDKGKVVSSCEFRFDGQDVDVKAGDPVDVSVFSSGDKVAVSGVSKAKGFQGVVKRHGFSGSPRTHGHRHDLRAPGSIGSAFPQHVFKGRKMAGRMGGVRSTVHGLTVVDVDVEKNLLLVSGSIPGVPGRTVFVSVL
ncbi:MAG: 50S ribosomal protein L3 [Candidatus Moranbacteria bacterium]|nr:50S ribosomal protein L3 [Candidatus Moranbacteria bacterium]